MINVAVLGYGTVGSGVVEVIEKNKEEINNPPSYTGFKQIVAFMLFRQPNQFRPMVCYQLFIGSADALPHKECPFGEFV